MKSLVALLSLILFLCFGSNLSYAACCAWTDRDACASCPDGYYSACITKGNECDCDCAKSSSETAEKMSYGDYNVRKYIEKNFEKIINDTKFYRYHDFQGIRISITPPK